MDRSCETSRPISSSNNRLSQLKKVNTQHKRTIAALKRRSNSDRSEPGYTPNNDIEEKIRNNFLFSLNIVINSSIYYCYIFQLYS